MELSKEQIRHKLYYLKKTGQIDDYNKLIEKRNEKLLTKEQIRHKLHYLKKTGQIDDYNKLFEKYRSIDNITIIDNNTKFDEEYKKNIQKNKYLRVIITQPI